MHKILIAYDGDEPAQLALERGAELAEAFGAELGVVSVTPCGSGRCPPDIWDEAGAHARALRSASDYLRARGLSATLLSREGDPGRMIEQVAEAGGFDTIVVGTRGLSSVGGLMQRSVSEQVVTSAKATVVVAR